MSSSQQVWQKIENWAKYWQYFRWQERVLSLQGWYLSCYIYVSGWVLNIIVKTLLWLFQCPGEEIYRNPNWILVSHPGVFQSVFPGYEITGYMAYHWVPVRRKNVLTFWKWKSWSGTMNSSRSQRNEPLGAESWSSAQSWRLSSMDLNSAMVMCDGMLCLRWTLPSKTAAV